MSDDFEEKRPERHERSRSQRQLDDYYNVSRERPNVITVFARLGYDVWNIDDMNRLASNLRFAQETRERQESTKLRRVGWIASLAIALLGAAVSSAGQWVANHIR